MCILNIYPTFYLGSTFISSHPTEPGRVEEQCRPVKFLSFFKDNSIRRKGILCISTKEVFGLKVPHLGKIPWYPHSS